MTNPILSAIDAAKNAAAQVATAQAAPVSTNVVRPGPALTITDMMVGGMNVDTWMKVNAYGLFIGKDRTPFTSLKLGLDMADVAYNYAIKFGNPAQYLKTYDHVTCVQGGSWADAISRAVQHDPKAREYRSADLPFKVLEDIKKPDGSVLIEAGKLIGHGLSTTGWKSFAEFVKKLQDADLSPENSDLIVTLGFTPMKNTSGEWGVLNFAGFEPAGE